MEQQDQVRNLAEAALAMLSATGRSVCSWPMGSEKRQAWRALDDALRGLAGAGDTGTTSEAVNRFLATLSPEAQP